MLRRSWKRIRTTMPRLLCSGALLYAGIPTANADGPQADHLPEKVSWVAHLDLEEVRQTSFFEDMQENGGPTGRSFGAWLQRRYNMRVQDLDAITVFRSAGESSETVALMYGDAGQKEFLASVSRLPGYERQQTGQLTVHSWEREQPHQGRDKGIEQNHTLDDTQVRDPELTSPRTAIKETDRRPEEGTKADGERVALAFMDNVAIFSSSVDRVTETARHIQNSEGNKLFEEVSIPEGAFFVMTTRGKTAQSNMANAQNTWKLLETVQQGIVYASEAKTGQVRLDVHAMASDEQAAERLTKVVDGLRAVLALSSDSESDVAARIGDRVPEIRKEGSQLLVSWNIPADQMIRMVERSFEDADVETLEAQSPAGQLESVRR